VVTHGDSDHSGNCAYLRRKYGAPIAMHRDEAGATEQGNSILSRKIERPLVQMTIKIILSFFELGKADRFKPDLSLEDGQSLAEYGFDAKILSLPGHTNGSIGILTDKGDLFCGDLLANWGKPSIHIMADMAAAKTSLEKLKSLEIKTIFPGHGKPFPMELFIKNHR
jgi:hydroxyacylglutathione hydrolase